MARDDLKDGGAAHFAQTIEAIRGANPAIAIEVLTPDFHAKEECLRMVADAKPHIFNHNVETVERLTPMVRSRAKYRLSLEVLRRFKEMAPEIVTKSGIMLGLGETESEIFQTMDDLREAGVQVLTMGQYLRPTPQHLPVVEYVHPDTFKLYREIAEEKGLRARGLGTARAQLVSRGGFQSAGALIPATDAGFTAEARRRRDAEKWRRNCGRKSAFAFLSPRLCG